jgi:hypothetical protein
MHERSLSTIAVRLINRTGSILIGRRSVPAKQAIGRAPAESRCGQRDQADEANPAGATFQKIQKRLQDHTKHSAEDPIRRASIRRHEKYSYFAIIVW